MGRNTKEMGKKTKTKIGWNTKERMKYQEMGMDGIPRNWENEPQRLGGILRNGWNTKEWMEDQGMDGRLRKGFKYQGMDGIPRNGNGWNTKERMEYQGKDGVPRNGEQH